MRLPFTLASLALLLQLGGCPSSEEAAKELKPVSTAQAQVAPGNPIPPPGPLPNQNGPDRPIVKPDPLVPTPMPSTTGPGMPGTQPPPTVPGVAPVPVVPGPVPVQPSPAPAQSPQAPAAGPAPPPPGTAAPR